MLQQFVFLDHLFEFLGGEEEVIHAVDFTGARRAVSSGDDEMERQAAFLQTSDQAVLSYSWCARDDNQ